VGRYKQADPFLRSTESTGRAKQYAGIYCRNISKKRAGAPGSEGNLVLEDGIYAEVNRLFPRKSEVIEC